MPSRLWTKVYNGELEMGDFKLNNPVLDITSTTFENTPVDSTTVRVVLLIYASRRKFVEHKYVREHVFVSTVPDAELPNGAAKASWWIVISKLGIDEGSLINV